MKTLFSIFALALSINALAVVTCGETGSVLERMDDCARLKDSTKGNFVRVAKTSAYKEVWIDTLSGLLWSDRLDMTMGHADAQKVCNDQLKEVAGIPGNWTLPTADDFNAAELNGVRKSLAKFDYWYWSADVVSEDLAWVYSGRNGKIFRDARYWAGNWVRCVSYNN